VPARNNDLWEEANGDGLRRQAERRAGRRNFSSQPWIWPFKTQSQTDFKYLGSTLSCDGDVTPEVRDRIKAAWVKWCQVTGVLCDRRMPRRLKGKIYKTVVRPVALYAAECWPAATNHEKALHAMEMRMLRWSLGLSLLDHATNVDVRGLLQVAPIQAKMRQARLRWFGHVMRRDDQSVVRTALRVDPAGQRPRGRPKKRWLDRLNEDMMTMNVTPEDAQDRTRWS